MTYITVGRGEDSRSSKSDHLALLSESGEQILFEGEELRQSPLPAIST